MSLTRDQLTTLQDSYANEPLQAVLGAGTVGSGLAMARGAVPDSWKLGKALGHKAVLPIGVLGGAAYGWKKAREQNQSMKELVKTLKGKSDKETARNKLLNELEDKEFSPTSAAMQGAMAVPVLEVLPEAVSAIRKAKDYSFRGIGKGLVSAVGPSLPVVAAASAIAAGAGAAMRQRDEREAVRVLEKRSSMNNKYLEKLAHMEKTALNRLVKHLAEKGSKLPPLDDIARDSFNEEMKGYVSKGALRSRLRYARGDRKRDASLMGRLGVTKANLTPERQKKLLDISPGAEHGAFLPGPDIMVGGSRLKGLTRRHEVVEADEFYGSGKHRLMEKVDQDWWKTKGDKNMSWLDDITDIEAARKGVLKNHASVLRESPQTMTPVAVGGNLTGGMHATLAVLGRESNMVRANPWHNTAKMSKEVPVSVPELRRSFTHEGAVLKDITGKTYGVDTFTGKDLRRLRKARPTGKTELEPGREIPAYTPKEFS